MAKEVITTIADQPARYINPLTDFGFKRIFGTEANKDLLIDFLEAVLDIDGGIRELHYANPERQGRLEVDRKAIFDLYCVTGKGEHIIVEMQNIRHDYFKDRVLYYATFPIQEQGEKSRKWDFELTPVYSVNIINFLFDENPVSDTDQYASYVQLIDRDTHQLFYDKLAFVFMELPRFTKEIDDLQTDTDRWMYVLRHLTRLQDLPEALRNRVFRKLFHVAEIAQMTPIERKSYDQSLKKYRDMYLMETELKRKNAELKKMGAELKRKDADFEKEKAELKKEKAELKKKAVHVMLKAGIPVEEIIEATGVDIKEIERIRKTIK